LRLLTSKPIQSAVGQNALKQEWQLRGRFVTVMFDQFHHAVLNNVESSLFFPDMVEGTLKSALFYSLEEF
jgi:hypothetical protein